MIGKWMKKGWGDEQNVCRKLLMVRTNCKGKAQIAMNEKRSQEKF